MWEGGVELLRANCEGSVGVGGVTKVAGPSAPGGVPGIFVMMGRGVAGFLGEGVFSPGSSNRGLSSKTSGPGGAGLPLEPRLPFRPRPNVPPIPPPVVFARICSTSASGVTVDFLREGLNASFNRPAGDGLRRCEAVVGAFRVSDRDEELVLLTDWELSEAFKVEGASVSAAMRGEERVRYPACDWCGLRVGLLRVCELLDAAEVSERASQ